MSQTREQQRAVLAHTQVNRVPEKPWEKYRTATLKAQALIRNAGLCQGLHFLQNKDKEDGSKRLVKDLCEHLKRAQVTRSENAEAFLAEIREMDLPAYLAATREALQCLVWQCRMVECVHDQRQSGGK